MQQTAPKKRLPEHLRKPVLQVRLWLCCGLLVLIACLPARAAESIIPVWSWTLLHSLPHDPDSFTQGFVSDGDSLIESSGLYGRSYVHRYHSMTGDSQARIDLPASLFAEGLALVGDTLYCLSWKSGRVLLLDRLSLAKLGELRVRGEAWGLASLGEQLVMSDGSALLTLVEPESFKIRKKIAVLRNSRPVPRLNDLTVIDGLVWANIWHENYLVAIDPASGNVVGELDLTSLVSRQRRGSFENVLNGIAWDPVHNGLWVTGKRWRERYLLRLQAPAVH